MARNRMIKPEFWTSKTLMRVSRDSRLLFIGLWNFCDDYGVCLASTRRIAGDVFPEDYSVSETMIDCWLAELEAQNLIIRFEYKTQLLLFVRSWSEHQIVPHPSKRKFIDDEHLQLLMQSSRDSHEDLKRVSCSIVKEKEKEKEKLICDTDSMKSTQPQNKVSNRNFCDEQFDKFWILYAKKVGKPKSIAEWRKLTEDEKDMAITAAPKHATASEAKYRKDPERWLRDRRWEDEIVEPEIPDELQPTALTPEQIEAACIHISKCKKEREAEDAIHKERYRAAREALDGIQ